MKRTTNNIFSIVVTLLLAISIGFTVYQIKSQNTPSASMSMPQMQQLTNNSSDNSSNENDIIKGKDPSNSRNNNVSNQQKNNQPPSSKQNNPKAPNSNIATKYIVLLGAETFFFMLSLLYLVFSKFLVIVPILKIQNSMESMLDYL